MRQVFRVSRSFRVVLVLFGMAAAGSAQRGTIPGLRGILSPGRPHADLITGTDPHKYLVNIGSGGFIRGLLQPSDTDLVAALYASDGRRVLDVASEDYPDRAARFFFIAESGGDYRLEITFSTMAANRSRYRIVIEESGQITPDDRKRAGAYGHLFEGKRLSENNARADASASYTNALRLFRELNDRTGEMIALLRLGLVHEDMDQFDAAVRCYNEASLLAQALRAPRVRARILGNLANAQSALGRSDEAIRMHEQALKIVRKERELKRQATLLYNLGGEYQKRGEFKESLQHFRSAQAIARKTGYKALDAASLNALGWSHYGLSRYEEAIGYFERALPALLAVDDRMGWAATMNNLGVTYVSMSRYEAALRCFERVLPVFRERHSRFWEATALNNMGWSYGNLGDYRTAIRFEEEALDVYRDIGNPNGEGHVLVDLGFDYGKVGEFEKAIGFHERALERFRETKDRGFEAITLKEIANLYYDRKEYDKSIDYNQRALQIRQQLNDRGGEGESLNNLGKNYSGLNQVSRAVSYHARALAISQEIKSPELEAEAEFCLMEAWRALAAPRLAIFYGKQAVNKIQSIRATNRGLTRELQQMFLSGNERLYHSLADVLISNGRLAEAEQVLSLLKTEEYFNFVRRDNSEDDAVRRHADLNAEESTWEERQQKVLDQLVAIGTERGQLVAKKQRSAKENERLAKLDQEIAAGNLAFDNFLTRMAANFKLPPQARSRLDQLRESQGIMEDLRELPAGTVAIYTLVGEDKLWAILVTPDVQKAYDYAITAADLNRKISQLRQVVMNPHLDPRPLAFELYTILLGGIREDLRAANAQTIMWSLDGGLRYLPMAALFDGQKYLVENYRMEVFTPASNARLKEAPSAKWRAAGFGVTASLEGFPALPGVATELTGIIAEAGGANGILSGEIKLDKAFTVEAMRKTLLKRYPVVHIASHFRFQAGDETKSFLLMGDGAHLSLAELKSLPSLFGGVQLITLSACETGIGAEMGDGREVEGFGALAQKKGAKAVIASLWPVADESTSQLMMEFYRLRESSPGITKAEAMRQAQLALLYGRLDGMRPTGTRGVFVNESPGSGGRFPSSVSAPFAHPYYWAPFFLMGNWL